jgi:hypothetical protein
MAAINLHAKLLVVAACGMAVGVQHCMLYIQHACGTELSLVRAVVNANLASLPAQLQGHGRWAVMYICVSALMLVKAMQQSSWAA